MGINGPLYKQFAVTLSSALVVSAIVALTLSSGLAAVLLDHGHGEARRGPLLWFSNGLQRARDAYGRSVAHLLRRPALSMLGLALVTAAAAWIFVTMPATFLPDDDQGALFFDV